MTYADDERVRDARARYFADNGFSEAGNNARWVVIALGPLAIVFPNTRARRRALRLHDLHHVATDYPTSFIGELEISAWEIGAGCGKYLAAWYFSLAGAMTGLVVAPRRVLRAFARGRRSRTLYRDGWRDELLDLTVGQLRAQLGL